MRSLAALVVLVAAACAPVTTAAPAANLEPQATPPAAAPSSSAPPADEASCKTAGGSWRPICRMQKPACVITYADAGKPCTDSSQCQGKCYAEKTTGAASEGKPATGACSTNSDPCGCHTLVQNGAAVATLCVD